MISAELSSRINTELSLQSCLNRVQSAAKKLDLNLDVSIGITLNGHSEKASFKVLVKNGSLTVASFPEDEIYSEREIVGEIKKGLTKIILKTPSQ